MYHFLCKKDEYYSDQLIINCRSMKGFVFKSSICIGGFSLQLSLEIVNKETTTWNYHLLFVSYEYKYDIHMLNMYRNRTCYYQIKCSQDLNVFFLYNCVYQCHKNVYGSFLLTTNGSNKNTFTARNILKSTVNRFSSSLVFVFYKCYQNANNTKSQCIYQIYSK